jgi:formylglycine-generating enzyme required for sulfatase activity
MKPLLYIAIMAPVPDLALELQQTRKVTDDLFELIHPESLHDRPIPERHRLIFYLGHLEAFDWNLIGQWANSATAFHPEFDRLFAFGIDPDESGLPTDQPNDWPSRPEVERYNARVRETLDQLLPEAPEQLLHVAIEHRLMHAETFAYLLHGLEYRRKTDGPLPSTAPAIAGTPAYIRIPAGRATLGRPEHDGFGWDNEFREYSVEVPEFTVSRYKVTNAEYLAFVREGGAVPHFWSDRDGKWLYRGMFGEVPLPLGAPVYVTHEQATEYASWAGGSLPTEAQWHRAAEGAVASGNLDFRLWDPVPVAATPESDSRWGVAQLIGNGWEWTSSVFEPFPGFEPFPFYRGYSADFFDGQHFVLKGASPRTARRLARHSFRNWFRARYPYVYATFRVVKDA